MSQRPCVRHTATLAALCLALLGVACDDEMGSPSTLEDAQIMAVQFTPRVLEPGGTHTAMVLGHALSETPLSLEACILPWIPEESGIRCSAEDVSELPEFLRGPIALGSGTAEAPQEVSFGIPNIPAPTCSTDAECFGLASCVDGTCPIRLWVKVVDESPEGALDAIAQIATGESVDNPEVTALEAEDRQGGLPETLGVGKTLVVQPTVTDPYGEGGRVLTYFTSKGTFDPWRTNEDGPSTYTAPEEAGEVTLTVIVRDPGGGVGWAQHTLTITEAP